MGGITPRPGPIATRRAGGVERLLRSPPHRFKRPADLSNIDNPDVLYARSYLLIRLSVGFVGALLPTLLIVLEWFFLNGDFAIRGSLSAYYHSGARDVFVGALCITGFLLVSYLSGEKESRDFRLSLVAGVAAFGVALLPTERSRLAESDPLCGSVPRPENCTQLQQLLGEELAASLHFICAGIFIVTLALICLFVFAPDERRRRSRRERSHKACGWIIIGAVAWAAVGGLVALFFEREINVPFFWFSDVYLTPLYLGEVVAVYAFATSWFIKGFDLMEYTGVLRRLPLLKSSLRKPSD